MLFVGVLRQLRVSSSVFIHLDARLPFYIRKLTYGKVNVHVNNESEHLNDEKQRKIDVDAD
ncbi:MAG: hypothetical protein ACKPKO_00280, partial [Candidatus Fonsibacter sp.]